MSVFVIFLILKSESAIVLDRFFYSFLFLRIALSIRWFNRFTNVITFISIMHAFAYASSCFIAIFMLIWTDRWRRFFRLRLWLILKNDDIDMFNDFQFFLTTFLYSRVVSSKWTFFSVAFFCKIQLSQNVEVHFRSTIKDFSTNIVWESKKFLISKIKIRLLRFFSIRYSSFNLIFEWWLLQCLKFLVYLFLDLIVDFLVLNN
jgi:hypothetical protein